MHKCIWKQTIKKKEKKDVQLWSFYICDFIIFRTTFFSCYFYERTITF